MFVGQPWSGSGAWDGSGAWGSNPEISSGLPLADYFAVVSMGSFPTPTPPSSAERAHFAATFGLRKDL